MKCHPRKTKMRPPRLQQPLQLECYRSYIKLCVLPELLGKWFTMQDPWLLVPCDVGEAETEEDDGSWCYCKQPKGFDI